jgi:hypothetical protein
MKNTTKTLMFTLVFAAFSALFSFGCTKAEPPKPAAANAPKMAPGQASGMYYMQQHGGGAPAGQQPQQGGR